MNEEDAGELEVPEGGRQTDKGPAPTDRPEDRDAKIEELTGDLKRLQAEFENFKKRSQKETAERSRSGAEALMYDLLAVLDTYDKAFDEVERSDDPETLRKGFKGIHRQLMQILQRQGLREVRTDGRFDPFEHEAIMREERDDIEEGRVLEVYQKGYLMGPRVIRTAKVKVSKAKEQVEGGADDDGQGEEDDHDEQESQEEER